MAKRDANKALKLMEELRETRKQIQKSSVSTIDISTRGFKEGKSKPPKTSDFYIAYKNRIDNLTEDNIDELTTRDLVYHFRDKAHEAGSRYVISNFKRDMGVMKKVRERYSIREVLLMIEFMFESEQDYIDKIHAQPTILVSNWTNTILPDAELWIEGKYIPRSKKKHSKREWSGEKSTEDRATIGEDWGI